jgi:predicted Zn-dependent protease
VYLHENGHVAGLGHSTDLGAVMYPSYQTARCALAADDRNGIAALY